MVTIFQRLSSSFALAIMGLTMLATSTTLACVICIPYPESTHADDLLESNVVVLAREDPAQPFSLVIVEVLKGSIGDVSTGVFLPSQIRRKLTLNSTDGIVLVQRRPTASWERVSYATPAYQAFVQEILANETVWRGNGGQQLRFTFFTERLNDKHPAIRQQAFLEIGRAPYSWIKRAARKVPVEQVRATLANWRLVEWHSLYILMLGQSKEEGDRAYIAKNFESAARYGTTRNLSAWATAYIETHPSEAIEAINERYFKNEERTRAELEEILRALSVVADADNPFLIRRKDELRLRISSAYKSLLEYHPKMAGWVARELMRWRRKALVERLKELHRDKASLDSASALAVDMYLAQAARFSGLAPSE